MVNILLVILTERSTGVRRRRIVADDRISFASPCLSVCKNRYVGAEDKLVN